MSTESFSIPESIKKPDESSEVFSNQKEIKEGCKNYVESLKNQWIKWEELDSTIWFITQLINKQDWEISSCTMDFLQKKEDVIINYRAELKKVIEQQNVEHEKKQRENDYNNALKTFWAFPELKETQNTLKNDVWLDLSNILIEYHNILNNTLKLPENSNIDTNEYNQLIEKVKQSIIIKLTKISNIVDKFKAKEKIENNDLTKLHQKKWIINEEIQEHLWFINKKLLPSIQAYIKLSSWSTLDYNYQDQYHGTWSIKDSTKYENDRYVDLESKKEEIQELFDADIDEEWNFSESSLGFYTQDIFDANDSADKFMLKELWVKDIDGSLLTPEAKEIENEATVAMLCFCACSCVPYLGAGISIPNDFLDVFTSNDQTIERLKEMDCIDKNYNVSKSWDTHLFAMLWLITAFVWATAIVKWKKIAELMGKINASWLSSEKVSAIMKTIGDKMWLKKGDAEKLTNTTSDTTPKKWSLFEEARKIKEVDKINVTNELKYVEEYQKLIDDLPPVKEWSIRLYRWVKNVWLELEFVKKSPEQSKLFSKLVRNWAEALTKEELNELKEILPLLEKWEARYFSTDFKTAGGYGFDKTNQEMWEIFYMDVPYSVTIDNMRETWGLQSRLWETDVNYAWDAISLHVDHLSKYGSKKIERPEDKINTITDSVSKQIDTAFLEKIDFSSIPKKGADWYDEYNKIVTKIGNMNNTQRLEAAELILGRPLEPQLANDLLEVHAATKAKVFEHTFWDLKTKLQKSNELGVRWNQPDQVSDAEFKSLMDWGILWEAGNFNIRGVMETVFKNHKDLGLPSEISQFNITGIPDKVIKVLGINPRASNMKIEMNVVANRISLSWDIKQMELLAEFLKQSWDKYKDIPSANLGILKHRIRALKEKQALELAESKKIKELAEAKKAEEAAEALLNMKEVSVENMSDFIKQVESDPSLLKEKSWDNKDLISYLLDNLKPDNLDQNFWKLDLDDIKNQEMLENLFNKYEWDDLNTLIKSLNRLSKKISNPSYQPDEILLKTIWMLDGNEEKLQLFTIGRTSFRWESFIAPAVESRVDQLVRWLRTLEKQKTDIQEVSLNKLEKDLLDTLDIKFDNFINVELIEKLRNGVINISTKLEGELLLQILNKLPEEFTSKHLKWYKFKIVDKINSIK